MFRRTIIRVFFEHANMSFIRVKHYNTEELTDVYLFPLDILI